MAWQVLLRKALLSLAILLGVVISGPVYCEEYYVDGNSGNDVGAGTYEDPWRTITHAVSQASETDTVYVKHATYHESVSLTSVAKSSINLIGMANGGAKPIICSPDPNIHTVSLTNYGGTIEGMEITGASDANGINCIASNSGTCSPQITACKIYGNNVGIHMTTVDSTDDCSPYIYKNVIYSNTTRGIGNMMYSSPTIEGNYIYKNGSGSVGHGGICNRDNSTAAIINNVIYENDHTGISIRDNGNPKIINDTITGHNATDPLSAAIKVNQNKGISSLLIVNNIITHNKYGLVSQFSQPCSGNDYNDVWNNFLSSYVGFTKQLNDISADPQFVDPEYGDYHLQRGSACIDAGTSLGAPDRDMDGDSRPKGAGYDLGAYEYAKDDGGGDDGGGGGGGCFVATAAFGSPIEQHVKILKNFRDTYILPYAFGRIFVGIYYKYSPPLAHFMAKYATLRAVMRIGLIPLFAISYSMLHFGPVITFTMLMVLLAIPIFLVSCYRRKASRYRPNS